MKGPWKGDHRISAGWRYSDGEATSLGTLPARAAPNCTRLATARLWTATTASQTRLRSGTPGCPAIGSSSSSPSRPGRTRARRDMPTTNTSPSVG